MAHSHLSGLMVKPFLCSQRKMVANSSTWWFQALEKTPTSLYIQIHNIIWIHIIWVLTMRIHIIGIRIYHKNLYVWICFVQNHIFSDNAFIIALAMSGEHLSPIGGLKYLYLPNYVMMVQGSWLLLPSSNKQYCILMLSLAKNLYPEWLRKMSVIISNRYCLRLMTLFSWRELLI